MCRWSSLLLIVCAGALLAQTLAAPTSDESIIVRSKRQQCRCVKNPNGGLTCSCAKGPANGSSSTSSASSTAQQDLPESADIANQLTAISQQSSGVGTARCGCIQIVFQGVPQYNCQCGDQNGNPLPTTTIPTTTTPTTTTSTTTTPTPTTASTTTTTQLPVSYPAGQQQGNNGACNCIMISITSPQTAQYQCQCAQPQQQHDHEDSYEYDVQQMPGTLPPAVTTSTQSPVYPAIGQLATGEESCFCLDPDTSVMSSCGCTCNCLTLMVSVPSAYCGCPQPAQRQNQYSETYDYTQSYSTQSTTLAPTTAAPTTTTQASTTANVVYSDATSSTQYPLTTTCVMYVNVPTTACSCLPQYDQCAQNVCCLKSKFRSYKKSEEASPSTIDMIMNVLQTIKTKLE